MLKNHYNVPPKIDRKCIRIRKKDTHKVKEQNVLDLWITNIYTYSKM